MSEIKSRADRDRVRQRAAAKKRESTVSELPKFTKLLHTQSLFTHTYGRKKWFEVVLAFTDGTKTVHRRWDLTMELLKEHNTGVTRLSETRKLKDWIMGAGRKYFEDWR